MDKPTLSNPDEYYARRPNPRYKTNCNNRSTFTFGDDRDWNFDTIHQLHFSVPVKIPPRHESILPGGVGATACTKAELDQVYVKALNKIGVIGVKQLELAIRMKIEQRTAGGPMALRKAFKYFDTDASGDIDPDEFYAAMHSFGLEFTEDQVLALFGFYDGDRDGGLSYYEFIDKVLESGFGLDNGGPKKPPTLVQLVAIGDLAPDVKMSTVLNSGDLNEITCKAVFDRFDANKSGDIDIRELHSLTRALGLSLDRESINNAMFELDRNRNGAISWDEFWVWWQLLAKRGVSRVAPRTGGGQSSPSAASRGMRRPKSEQSSRGVQSNFSRPGSRASGNELRWDADLDKARPSSRSRISGGWRQAGNRPSSSLSIQSRPNTRNTQRSVAGADFCPPPLLSKPPRLYGLKSLQMNLPPRPKTAPDGQLNYLRVPGAPAVPTGVTTGYVL